MTYETLAESRAADSYWTAGLVECADCGSLVKRVNERLRCSTCECERCHDTGLVTLKAYNGVDDADDQPCPLCGGDDDE